MKYFISFLLIIFTFSLAQGQTQSGEITYSVTADEKMMDSIVNQKNISSDLRQGIQDLFDYQTKTIPFLSYKLIFNEKESLFYLPNNMSNDNKLDLQTIARNVGVEGKYYIDQEEKTSYHQFEYISSKLIVKHSINQFDWKITKESKIINGYLSYKAIAYHKPDVGLGEKIIAWFTPNLPFQTGPLVYAGLPGLILELKQGYYIFTAENINLLEKQKKIRKPTKGKIITLENLPKEKNKIKMDYMKARTY